MGKKSAQNLIAAIERSKEQDLSRLLYAFGIRQVGQKAGKILAARFRTLDAIQSATLEELTAVDDIGAITAQSILDWFASPQSQHLIARLKEAGVNMTAAEQGSDQRFAGHDLCAHRLAGALHPGPGLRPHRGAGGQVRLLRIQKDHLCGGRGGGGLQA